MMDIENDYTEFYVFLCCLFYSRTAFRLYFFRLQMKERLFVQHD